MAAVLAAVRRRHLQMVREERRGARGGLHSDWCSGAGEEVHCGGDGDGDPVGGWRLGQREVEGTG